MLLVFYFDLFEVKGQSPVFVSIRLPEGNILEQEFQRFKAL